jgi:hypothetical protein
MLNTMLEIILLHLLGESEAMQEIRVSSLVKANTLPFRFHIRSIARRNDWVSRYVVLFDVVFGGFVVHDYFCSNEIKN